MIAVWKHELKNYFHSLTAYIFGAFLLAFIGLGALRYNIQAAVSNFEFVLSYGCLIFVVIVPILTMRVIAEETKDGSAALLPAHYHGAGGPGQVSGSAGGLCRPPVSDLPVPADLLPIRGRIPAHLLRLYPGLFGPGCRADRAGDVPLLSYG